MENIVALVAATIVLILIPGPNVALIVANCLRHGLRFGLLTVLGTTVGIAMQLFFVVVGFAALIERVAGALLWIKWLGVIYLLILGVRAWREPAADLTNFKPQRPRAAFLNGIMLAIINPKTLLFNAAFLPQFIAAGGNASAQMVYVCAVFLTVVIVGDALWALFAAAARRGLQRYGHLRNRITGGFMLGAGLGLALSRRDI